MDVMDVCNAIIIDDNVDLINTYSEILEVNGIKVIGTGNDGKMALDLYKKYKPSVVILDMKMPKFDGNYAIKHIKEFDPNARIIVMTGYTECEPDLEEIYAIIQKPTNIDDLIELVKNTCASTKK